MKKTILNVQNVQVLSKEELLKKVGGGFNQCIEWFCCDVNTDGSCAIWSYNCDFYFTYCP